MTSYIELSNLDLALASLLLVMNGILSMVLGLGVTRQLAIAAVRMVIQLALVALVLEILFTQTSLGLTLGAGLIMALVAGYEALARQERRLKGWWAYGLGTTALLIAGGLVILLTLTVFVRPDPVYDPRYAIPLFGMILGNCLTGVSLGLDTLTTGVARERSSIEARLLLGETRYQALNAVARRAVRTGMMPLINSMAATGIVSLPGMMTGQILAGIQPGEAARYQILIMMLLAGATALGVIMAVGAGMYRLTDDRHRLRLDRLLDRL